MPHHTSVPTPTFTTTLGVSDHMASDSFRIVETIAEAESGEGSAIVVPTLRLDKTVSPLVQELSSLAQSAEAVSVWRPLHSTTTLRGLRGKFRTIIPRYTEIVTLCHSRMEEPVERGSSMDNAWLQGFSTALGTSALFRLQSAFQSVGEVLDRKAAYTLAGFSIYVAILSMSLTVIFGYLSLK